jgi:hypothetical protein
MRVGPVRVVVIPRFGKVRGWYGSVEEGVKKERDVRRGREDGNASYSGRVLVILLVVSRNGRKRRRLRTASRADLGSPAYAFPFNVGEGKRRAIDEGQVGAGGEADGIGYSEEDEIERREVSVDGKTSTLDFFAIVVRYGNICHENEATPGPSKQMFSPTHFIVQPLKTSLTPASQSPAKTGPSGILDLDLTRWNSLLPGCAFAAALDSTFFSLVVFRAMGAALAGDEDSIDFLLLNFLRLKEIVGGMVAWLLHYFVGNKQLPFFHFVTDS